MASPETSAHAKRLTSGIQADPEHTSILGARGSQAQHPRVGEDSSGTQASVPTGHSVPRSQITSELGNQTLLEASPDHTRKNPARDPGTASSDHRRWSSLRTKRPTSRYQAFPGRFGGSGRGTTNLKRCHTTERDCIGRNLRVLPSPTPEKRAEETTPSRQQ